MRKWKLVFTLISIAGFLVFKLTHLTFRFGDGNAYVYMAQAILNGHLPYTDFFLADPPFFVLFLVPFKLLFGSHLILFQVLPVLLESATAFLLFLILKKWGSKFDFLAPAIYLFSFTILSTSDFMTGLQLTVFLSVLGFYLFESDKIKSSGFFLGLACLSKLYAVPVVLGVLIFLLFKKDRKALKGLVLGGLLSFVIFLVPFLFLAPQKLVDYTLLHQLKRPGGIDKLQVLEFFVSKEWLLFIMGLLSGFFALKRRIYLASFLCMILFLLIFKDLYFLYLGVLIPFLSLFFVLFLEGLWDKARNFGVVLIILLVIFGPYTFLDYKNNFQIRGRIMNLPEITEGVKKLPGEFLYGSHEIAPLIALASGKKLFEEMIDTNPQSFASGAQDIHTASGGLVESGGYLISRITDRPDLGVTDLGYEGFFEENIFKQYCKRVEEFLSTSNETDNKIVIYHCSK